MKRFSNWGLVTENQVFLNGRNHTVFDVGGLSQLDYLDLYKKFTYKTQESYRLDYIAEVELGQKKLDHSEFETFKDFYSGEFNVSDDEEVIKGSLRHKGKIRSLIKNRLQWNK